MRLRTFTASSMPEALKLIKAELGDDAIILSSKEQAGGIQVVAAMDDERPNRSPMASIAKSVSSAKPTPSHHELTAQQLRFDVQSTLRFHGIPEIFIAKMLATLTEATTAHILARSRMNIADESKYFLKLALEHIAGDYFAFSKPLSHAERIMLVGMPGIGKTLTCAKLATQFALSGTTPLVITTDISRAGGIEQLKAFTDILGIDIITCQTPGELQNELRAANKHTPVIIDTAGCNPYDEGAMDELAALCSITGIEPVLVMASGMDNDEAIDMAEAFMQMPIHRVIATRTDSTRRMGSIVSVAAAHKLAFYLASSSASVTDGLQPFSPPLLGQMLIAPMLKRTANPAKSPPLKTAKQCEHYDYSS